MTTTYIVTGDTHDLARTISAILVGWTPETLTEALRAPLAALDVDVRCEPNQSGGGGLPLDLDNDDLLYAVEALVERVIQDGPAAPTMTDIAHTAGPWAWSPQSTLTPTTVYCENEDLGSGIIALLPWATPARRSAIEAYARLIAAAPELLAIVEAVLDDWEVDALGINLPEDDPELGELIKKTRNVLAKVRGETAATDARKP